MSNCVYQWLGDRVNPDYFLSLDPEYRVTLLAHEIWHTALSHLTRLENRNPHCFNRACDYAMNLMLRDQGYKIHLSWLCDDQYRGMTAEEIYEVLITDPDNSQPFDQADMNYTNPATTPAQAQQINNNIIKAHVAATMASQGSSIPGGVTQTVNQILTPVINWKAIFARFVQMLAKMDYSFKKVNRRFFPDFILPTMAGEKVEEMVVACDSSASVSDADLAAYLGQINQARAILKPERTKLIMFDTSVQDVKEFQLTNPVNYVDFKGRGGTDPECVFEYIRDNKIKPKLLVILSDMDFTPLDASLKPDYPVLWVSYKAYRDPVVNFGKLVIMPESK